MRQLAGFVEAIRRMIRRHRLQHARLQRRPQGLLSVRVAQRWAAAIFRAFDSGKVHRVFGEQQIVRTGLAVHLRAHALRRADGRERVLRGHVNDEHGRVEKPGELDHAIRRFGFRQRHVTRRVVLRRGAAAFEQLCETQRITSLFSACTITSARSRAARASTSSIW